MVEIVPPLSGGTLHHFCLDFELDFVSGGGDGGGIFGLCVYFIKSIRLSQFSPLKPVLGFERKPSQLRDKMNQQHSMELTSSSCYHF